MNFAFVCYLCISVLNMCCKSIIIILIMNQCYIIIIIIMIQICNIL